MGRMLDICPEPRLKSCLLNVNVAAAKWVSNRKIISSEEKKIIKKYKTYVLCFPVGLI